MKRTNAPRFWKIHRKDKFFIIEPSPGAHPKNESIPLGILIRDYFHHADNTREIKAVLHTGEIEVNGRKRKDHRFPVGLMDCLKVGDEFYRVLPTKKGLQPVKISDKDIRLLRIENKVCLPKSKIQLNLTGGVNMLTQKNECNTSDVLVLEKDKITDVLKFEKGNLALVVGGGSIGELGTIEKIDSGKNMQPTNVILKIKNEHVVVPKRYIYIVGKKTPVIEVGGNLNE